MTLSLTAENEALKAHVNSLREALQITDVLLNLLRESKEGRLKNYVKSCHNSLINVSDAHDHIKFALFANPSQCLAIHDAKVIEEFRGRCEPVGMWKASFNGKHHYVVDSLSDMDEGDDAVPLYTLPIEKE